MSSCRVYAAALLLALCAAGVVAQPTTAPAAAADGTWKWSQPGFNGETEITLTLKQDGEKVTGSLNMMDRQTDITDGTYKDGQLSFKVARDFNGQKIVTTYTGTIANDTFNGKSETVMSRAFNAKKS